MAGSEAGGDRQMGRLTVKRTFVDPMDGVQVKFLDLIGFLVVDINNNIDPRSHTNSQHCCNERRARWCLCLHKQVQALPRCPLPLSVSLLRIHLHFHFAFRTAIPSP